MQCRDPTYKWQTSKRFARVLAKRVARVCVHWKFRWAWEKGDAIDNNWTAIVWYTTIRMDGVVVLLNVGTDRRSCTTEGWRLSWIQRRSKWINVDMAIMTLCGEFWLFFRALVPDENLSSLDVGPRGGLVDNEAARLNWGTTAEDEGVR